MAALFIKRRQPPSKSSRKNVEEEIQSDANVTCNAQATKPASTVPSSRIGIQVCEDLVADASFSIRRSKASKALYLEKCRQKEAIQVKVGSESPTQDYIEGHTEDIDLESCHEPETTFSCEEKEIILDPTSSDVNVSQKIDDSSVINANFDSNEHLSQSTSLENQSLPDFVPIYSTSISSTHSFQKNEASQSIKDVVKLARAKRQRDRKIGNDFEPFTNLTEENTIETTLQCFGVPKAQSKSTNDKISNLRQHRRSPSRHVFSFSQVNSLVPNPHSPNLIDLQSNSPIVVSADEEVEESEEWKQWEKQQILKGTGKEYVTPTSIIPTLGESATEVLQEKENTQKKLAIADPPPKQFFQHYNQLMNQVQQLQMKRNQTLQRITQIEHETKHHEESIESLKTSCNEFEQKFCCLEELMELVENFCGLLAVKTEPIDKACEALSDLESHHIQAKWNLRATLIQDELIDTQCISPPSSGSLEVVDEFGRSTTMQADVTRKERLGLERKRREQFLEQIQLNSDIQSLLKLYTKFWGDEDEQDSIRSLEYNEIDFFKAANSIFDDVNEEFKDLSTFLTHLVEVEKYAPDLFLSLGLFQMIPEILSALVKWQLLWWCPFQLIKASSLDAYSRSVVTSPTLESFTWFQAVVEYIEKTEKLACLSSENLPRVDTITSASMMNQFIKLVIIPKIKSFVLLWDPLNYSSSCIMRAVLDELLLFNDKSIVSDIALLMQQVYNRMELSISCFLTNASISKWSLSFQKFILWRCLHLSYNFSIFNGLLKDSLLQEMMIKQIFLNHMLPLLNKIDQERIEIVLNFISILPQSLFDKSKEQELKECFNWLRQAQTHFLSGFITIDKSVQCRLFEVLSCFPHISD